MEALLFQGQQMHLTCYCQLLWPVCRAVPHQIHHDSHVNLGVWHIMFLVSLLLWWSRLPTYSEPQSCFLTPLFSLVTNLLISFHAWLWGPSQRMLPSLWAPYMVSTLYTIIHHLNHSLICLWFLFMVVYISFCCLRCTALSVVILVLRKLPNTFFCEYGGIAYQMIWVLPFVVVQYDSILILAPRLL